MVEENEITSQQFDFALSRLMLEVFSQIRIIHRSMQKFSPLHSNYQYSDSMLKSTARKVLKLTQKSIKADGCVLYFLSRNGSPYQVYKYGKNFDYENTSFVKVKQPDAKTLALKIPIKSSGSVSPEGLLGYYVFYREKSFSTKESKYLSDILNILGHSLSYLLDIRAEIYFSKLHLRIQFIIENERKAGSVIYKMLAALHDAYLARTSYFVVFNNRSMCVEYVYGYQHSRRKIIINPPFQDLPIVDFLEDSIVITRNDNEYELLYDALGRHVMQSENGSHYLLFLFKKNMTPTAAIILEFSVHTYCNFHFIKKIIDTFRAKLEINVTYLHQRRFKRMIINPIFQSRDTRVNQKKAFVLMPFTLPWSDRIWRMLKKYVSESGLEAIRADDLYGQQIIEDIWEGILQARLIIADTTGKNPNVFYELGVAHTLGKPFILLTQNIDDIPLDLNRYRHIIYEDNADGYEKLSKELKLSIQELLATTYLNH